MTESAATVLRVLARLAPSRRTVSSDTPVNLTAPGSSAVWLGLDGMWTARPGWRGERFVPRFTSLREAPIPLPESSELNRLAAMDQLHHEDRRLRAGWTVLSGRTAIDGSEVSVCTPLVSWPARLVARDGGGFQLSIAGDLEATPLVTDRDGADGLAERADFCQGGLGENTSMELPPRFTGWVQEICAAAGLPEPLIEPPAINPLRRESSVLTAVAGLVLYTAHPAVAVRMRETLWAWAERPGIQLSALAQLYSGPEEGPPPSDDNPVISPLPLSPAQQAVVRSARGRAITVVSGPPGCGKTHTLAALALDTVARGESVLLATRSPYAADVIGDMLERAAGPTPVLFGDTELRRAIVDELSAGLSQPFNAGDVQTQERRLADAVDGVHRLERAVAGALADESAASRARLATELAAIHRVSAPALFDGELEPASVATALGRARLNRRWLLAGWRSRRAHEMLRKLVGAEPDVAMSDIAAALEAARDQRRALRLQLAGGTKFGGLRPLLFAADAAARDTVAGWMDALASSADRRRRRSRRAVAALASALRAGRATRRRLLADIGGEELVRALPLWVGTLGDIDDLLPPEAGLFDLVVIDEASHVEQPAAASALVRARRAVIAGDPRQLRHVSFVSGEQVHAAVTAEGAEALSGLLDSARMSLFDVGAASGAVHWLDEHRRCAPHLIGFAGRRFYPGRLSLLTTHPSIADTDCIDVQRVLGHRDSTGANTVEVAAAVAHARQRVDAGVRSLGLLSPLRAQADALEEAVLAKFTVEEITGSGLRTGTVHSFQGSECDELVVSLTLSDSDPAASWRFVDDPNLLAVLTTRARQSVHVITSATNPPGLVAEYLTHADEPPSETVGSPADDPWTAALAGELSRSSERVRTGYPVGRWQIDLVLGDDKRAVALETRPHPDGVQAHLDRWRTLADTGWRIHDAYPTRFGHDPVRAAVALLGELDAVR